MYIDGTGFFLEPAFHITTEKWNGFTRTRISHKNWKIKENGAAWNNITGTQQQQQQQ